MPDAAHDPVDNLLTSVDALEAYYGAPKDRSLWKELDHISDQYLALIEASPFAILATAGPEGLDASPRGDPAGFAAVLDPRTVAIPDRPGNNRLDSLKNIVRDPRVALLFLIPGKGETMRVNGRARISIDPALLERFAMNGKPPRAVILVEVERAYFQCQKAIHRAGLWTAEQREAMPSLPSAGEMSASVAPEPFDAKAYDREYPERMKREMY